jgi:hypothetical protein
VGVHDAVGGDPLGFKGMGFTLLERPSTFRALCRCAGQAAQEDNRVGLAATLAQWFAMRWQIEVTFQEARRHLGFETQRQWSGLAIRRTTPALLGLFSLVTLFAHRQMTQAAGAFRQAALYHKSHPTFADALALARKELWAQQETFCGSAADTDTVKVPRAFMQRLTETLCYAA